MKEKSKIKKMREKRGLSLKQAAKAIGVSHVAIIKWEHGKAFPKKDNLVKYARILDCSIADFF